MRAYSNLFSLVQKRTGMYLRAETYACACAFVLGYDLACEGGVLLGFREWLVLRLRAGNNLAWSALVLHVAFPKHDDPQAEVGRTVDSERVAIDTLFGLIAEFEVARANGDGLRSIFLAYQNWLDAEGI